MVIGETATPFVLQRLLHGRIDNLSMERPEQVGLYCFKQRATTFTKQGYVSLLLMTLSHGQFYIYIKKERVRNFYAAFCMDSVAALMK